MTPDPLQTYRHALITRQRLLLDVADEAHDRKRWEDKAVNIARADEIDRCLAALAQAVHPAPAARSVS